jgi:hypothetical protein
VKKNSAQGLLLDVLDQEFLLNAESGRVLWQGMERDIPILTGQPNGTGETWAPVSWLAEIFDQQVSFGFSDLGGGAPYPVLNLEPDYEGLAYDKAQIAWAQAAAWSHLGPIQAKEGLVGGSPRGPLVKDVIVQTLDQQWQIKDRAGFLKTLEDLRDRGYSEVYQDFADSIEAMSSEELGKIRALNLKHKTRISYEFYKKHKETLLGRNLRALDLTRVIQLAGWGYLAGYMAFDTSVSYMMKAAQDLQKIYLSWEDALEHVLLGMEFMTGQSRTDRNASAYKLAQFHKSELKKPDSLWNRTPWVFYLY